MNATTINPDRVCPALDPWCRAQAHDHLNAAMDWIGRAERARCAGLAALAEHAERMARLEQEIVSLLIRTADCARTTGARSWSDLDDAEARAFGYVEPDPPASPEVPAPTVPHDPVQRDEDAPRVIDRPSRPLTAEQIARIDQETEYPA